jgi:DNA-binding NarL/FixJ family response regulator
MSSRVRISPLNPPTSLLESPLRKPPEPSRRLELERLHPSQSITPRQRQVLYCLIEGKPTKRICEELDMSMGTAKVHIGAILRALGVRNRTQATLAALREGWIYPEMWSRS